MHYRLITITLLGFGMMISTALPAYAQTTTASSTQEEITTSEPNPFLPVPTVATSTQPAATTTPTTTSPTLPVKKDPVVKKVTLPVTATTTASSTPIASTVLPPLSTNSTGSVYLFASVAPLNTQATAGMLGAALLAAIIGFLFVQKRFLERMLLGSSSFPIRSVREPQAQSQ